MEGFPLYFFAAFGLLAACAGNINILPDIRSWNEARDACRKQVSLGSCDLITKTRLSSEWSDLGLTEDANYWVGAQVFSRWFWDAGENGTALRLFEEHGCYSLPALDADTLPSSSFNGPHQCYRACEDRAFVYLLGNKCYCSHALEGEVASPELCDIPCEGSADKCGGSKGHFSVFSIPQVLEFADRDPSRKCAAAQIRDNRLKVTATRCSDSRHYFCESDKQASEIDARSTDYSRAVDRCRSQHQSRLVTLESRGSSGQLVADLKSMEDRMPSWTTFWLPLRRHVRLVWLDGEEGEEGGELGQCLAVTPVAASTSYRPYRTQCSESYAAICDCSGDKTTPDGKKGTSSSSNKTIIIVVVVFVMLTAMVAVVVVLFLKRRGATRSMEQAWGNRENPFYKTDQDPTQEMEKA